jgi:hypothetical protein
MTLDTILVVIAVTMMFATVATVIAWGDKQTRNLPRQTRFLAKTSSSR